MNKFSQRFRRIKAWHSSIEFVENIYKISAQFPAHELYGLTSQLRRAAISIPLNVAEGSAADSEIEFCRFLTIALKSSYEVMCALEISKRLGYCSDKDFETLANKCDNLSAMISSFRKTIKNKSPQK